MKKFFYLATIAALLTSCLLTTSCKKDKEPETSFDIENIVFINENEEVVTGAETIDADGNTHEYVLVNTDNMTMFSGKLARTRWRTRTAPSIRAKSTMKAPMSGM